MLWAAPAAAQKSYTGVARGTLRAGNLSVLLTRAYARALPDEDAFEVVLTDRDLPFEALDSDDRRAALAQAGRLRGIVIEVARDTGELRDAGLLLRDREAPASSGNVVLEDFGEANGLVSGRLTTEPGSRLRLDVQFRAPLRGRLYQTRAPDAAVPSGQRLLAPMS